MRNDDATTTEIWRPIPGWEGTYEVSDHGYNNRLSNLRWATHIENMADRERHKAERSQV